MRSEKTSMVSEMRARLTSSEFAFFVDHSGLDVERVRELKTKLRAAGSEIHVIQNRLFKTVAVERGWSRLEGVLRGPTSMITGGDIVAVARILKDFMATDQRPVLKAGMDGSAFLRPADMEGLAALPSLTVMRSILVGTIAAPLSGLVGVLSQKLLSLVYVLKAVESKRSKEEA